MPITLNGTTGIAGVDGSAATPAVQGSDTNTGVFYPAADTVGVSTGGSERMRVDSSGNVGIGTNSPSQLLTISGAAGYVNLTSTTGTNTTVYRANNTGGYTFFGRDSSTGSSFGTPYASVVWANGAYPMLFATNDVERMRIDSSGSLLVGVTSASPFGAAGGVAAKGYASKAGYSGSFTANVFNTYWTGSGAQLYVDTSNLGTIAFTSDYRIKRNISTQTESGIDRIMKLRPVSYQIADYKDLFKATDEIKEGFIAHEMQEVIPSAVEGEKDAEDKIQSLRLDALCSVLVKAVQELSAKVDAQAAEIAALKANAPA